MNRKTFIKKSFYTLTSLSIVSGMYAWQIEPFWLEFVKRNMPIKNLPTSLIGKTLMQISDIHVSDIVRKSFLIKSFKRAKEYNPDIVVYTGDYVNDVDGKVDFIQLEEVLKEAVKGKLATLAILGNHDYGKNWADAKVANLIAQRLEANGIQVLRNNIADVSGLFIIGMDDYWGTNFNPKEAMQYYKKDTASIVLCHNPDVCDLNIWGDYNSWILSGHTHGGQVKPPFLKPPVVPVQNKNYTCGIFHLSNNRTLYINRALGYIKQVRFNVRPEITIFELQTMEQIS